MDAKTHQPAQTDLPPFSPPASPPLTEFEETWAYLKACGVLQLG
jgi:hypothetical protein